MDRAGEIDWGAIASELGCIVRTEHGWQEHSGTDAACRALDRILGEDAMRASVDFYVARRPGAALARSVLWHLCSSAAMDRCHEIFLKGGDIEDRRAAVELLRVVADARVLEWVPLYLADPDDQIQQWGIGVVDQLLFSRRADAEDCEAILCAAETHSNERVRLKAREVREMSESFI